MANLLCIAEKSMENEESKEFLQSENQGKNGFIKIVPSETFSIIPLSSSPPSSLSPSSGMTVVPFSDFRLTLHFFVVIRE